MIRLKINCVVLLALAACWLLPARQAAAQAVVASQFNIGNATSGISMTVQAAASADHRYVMMNVHPMIRTIDAIDTISIPGTEPISIIGPAARTPNAASITILNQDPALLNGHAPAVANPHSTLASAVQMLAQKTGANIVLSPAALQAAGINPAAPLAVDLPAQSIRDSLVTLMQQAAPGRHIVITSADNVIFITTEAQDDRQLVTRWYDLGAVIGAIPRFVPRGTNLQTVGHGPMDVRDLIMLVRPKVWKKNGGQGEIDIIGSQVRIKAPASVQALLQIPEISKDAPPIHPLYVGYGTK